MLSSTNLGVYDMAHSLHIQPFERKIQAKHGFDRDQLVLLQTSLQTRLGQKVVSGWMVSGQLIS